MTYVSVLCRYNNNNKIDDEDYIGENSSGQNIEPKDKFRVTALQYHRRVKFIKTNSKKALHNRVSRAENES